MQLYFYPFAKGGKARNGKALLPQDGKQPLPVPILCRKAFPKRLTAKVCPCLGKPALRLLSALCRHAEKEPLRRRNIRTQTPKPPQNRAIACEIQPDAPSLQNMLIGTLLHAAGKHHTAGPKRSIFRGGKRPPPSSRAPHKAAAPRPLPFPAPA